MVRVHSMHVSVKVKYKAGGNKEAWMMRDIEVLVRKKGKVKAGGIKCITRAV